ncbi:MAG: hypothetical protein GW769_12505 [Alphaproteobacteria bacterium]|nr:hypothetical protein [Alphaproteobacteria bacterium]NCT07567.1 hypothetical protein [Alphaproteobacteria bacterium]
MHYKLNPKLKLFFFLILHLFTLDAKTSVPKLNLTELTDPSAPSERPTIPLHFSHLQSPIMRNMGYCQLAIFEGNTETFYNFPLFNIYNRKPERLSPKERKELKEHLAQTGEILVSPRTRPYETDYSIPRELLCPGNSLHISFFQESIYVPSHRRKIIYTSWQGLNDKKLMDFISIPLETEGETLASLSLSINWNRPVLPSEPLSGTKDLKDDFFFKTNTAQELKAATTWTAFYEKIPTL